MMHNIPGFADAGAQVLSASAEQNDLVLEIRSLAATLVVIELFLDYHWKIVGQPALVTGISLTASTQLKLRQWASDMISPMNDWPTIMAAVFLDPLRVRQVRLAGKGIPNLQYLSILLSHGEVNINAIRWATTDELRKELLIPFDAAAGADRDPAFQYLMKRREDEEPACLAAFVFRVSNKRKTKKECVKLLEICDDLAADKLDDLNFIYRHSKMPEILHYERLLPHPLLPPGIPSEFPYAQSGTGFRAYRDFMRTPFDISQALIITTVKGIDGFDLTLEQSDVSFLIISNIVGNVLVCAIINARDKDSARRLWPNVPQEVPVTIGSDREEMIGVLARIIGYNKYLVGWKVEADLIALGISIPAIQVVDLAHEHIVIDSLLAVDGTPEIADITHLDLAHAIWNCSPRHLNIRQINGEDIRDAFIDNQCVCMLSRKFGKRILERKQIAQRVDMLSHAQTSVGGGRLLESFLDVQAFEFAPLLPRENELAIPGGINPMMIVGEINYGIVYRNRDEFYDKMMFRTSHPENEEIFDLTRLPFWIETIPLIERDLEQIRMAPHRNFQVLLPRLVENTYDWPKMFMENDLQILKNGIAFAENLHGLLVENPDGPLNIRNKFTILEDPDLHPSQGADNLSDE